ncbi:pre-toxin TG domain-containing protein [Bacillus arachidis]|uniref:pre-toxin TG domain-containing protein n=1 Tax=Bacillus arachidis TaxID=2819290 RepID=UPI003D8169AC
MLSKALSNSWSFSVYGSVRAVTGIDPRTGKELYTKERLIAAGWTDLNVIPVGKVGKGIKFIEKNLETHFLMERRKCQVSYMKAYLSWHQK